MSFYFKMPEKVIKNKKEVVLDCTLCGLCHDEKLKSPKMAPFIGEQYEGIVIVADTPSTDDDVKGVPLINNKAKLIRSAFLKNKINLINKSAITYAIRCQTYKAKDIHYQCCRNAYLRDTLIELKPKVIIALGDNVLKSIMDVKYNVSTDKARNRVIPNFEFNCVVFPIFNPNFIKSHAYTFAVERDIQRISDLWHNKFHKRTYINQLLKKRKILEDITIHEIRPNEVDEAFKEIKSLKETALDYEATGIKPYDSFFEITHISFGIEKYAWVFHESIWENNSELYDKIKNHMVEVLTDPNILKVIQNAKFEDLCSRYVFKTKKLINTFCTMLATHVIDGRRGCTSLDFQNYVRFGIPPYSDTVKPFLKKKNKDDLTNSIRKAPHNDLITYAGLDVITTFHNYLVLNNELLPNAYPQAMANYRLLHKGHWVFANMSQRGFSIDFDEFSAFESRLDTEIDSVLKEISSIPEFIEYEQYLESKTVTTKTGDKKIKQLLNTTKGQDNESLRKPRTNRNVNRKISFK